MAKISKRQLFTIISFGIGFIIPALGFLLPQTFFTSREQISLFFQGFGIWTPLVFIALSSIPVVFTPLNHAVFGIAGGFIFGPWLGFLLNWIAKFIGTFINFSIGRFFGNKIARNVAKKEGYEQYNDVFKQHKFLLFILFSFNDTLSYLAGISSMKFTTFLLIISVAHIMPALTLAYIGGGISLTDPLFIGIALTITLLTFSYFYLKKKL